MQRPIVRSRIMLSRKAEPATAADLLIAQDLLDTLVAHEATCAGMAANMIGQNKAIIVFFDEHRRPQVMLNPHITSQTGPFQTEEGCLSLEGTRPTTRYRRITVTWQDQAFAEHTASYQGFVAEVIQHECDHLAGIII